MQLLAILFLTLSASAPQVAWQSAGGPSAELRLLRPCGPQCPSAVTCRRAPLSAAARPKLLLLLNFTLEPGPADPATVRLHLWLTCTQELTSNLTIVLHHHGAAPGRQVEWTPTFRGCRRPPALIPSAPRDPAAGRWRADVSAVAHLQLRAARAVEVVARDEDGAVAGTSSPSCPAKSASTFIPREVLLVPGVDTTSLFNRTEDSLSTYLTTLSPVDYVLWVHLTDPAAGARVGLTVALRVDLLLPSSASAPRLCVLTANTSHPILASVSALPAARAAQFRLLLLSNLSVATDASLRPPTGVDVHDRLSAALLARHLAAHRGMALTRRRLDFALPPAGPAPLLLLRLDISAPAAGRPGDLSRLVVRGECLPDRHMSLEVDATEAERRGVRRSQLTVNSGACHFMGDGGRRWRLKFPFDACGSLAVADPKTGWAVYTNRLVHTARANGPPLVLRTIKCPVMLARPTKKATVRRRAYSPVPGRNLFISYPSEPYTDFHVLACGVDGSHYPIYTIFHDNRSVDNQLLHFRVLAPAARRYRFALLFKRSYPFRDNPIRVFCLVEGCRRGSLDRTSPDGVHSCLSGERLFRTKIVLADLVVRWSYVSNEQPASALLYNRIRLRVGVWVWAAAFLLGVVSVTSMLCIWRHTRR